MIPCKECKDRHIACHSTCEKYIKWSEEHVKEKQRISDAKFKQNIAESFLIGRREKRKRDRNLRGQKLLKGFY